MQQVQGGSKPPWQLERSAHLRKGLQYWNDVAQGLAAGGARGYNCVPALQQGRQKAAASNE
jgi:hypothetical protein